MPMIEIKEKSIVLNVVEIAEEIKGNEKNKLDNFKFENAKLSKTGFLELIFIPKEHTEIRGENAP